MINTKINKRPNSVSLKAMSDNNMKNSTNHIQLNIDEFLKNHINERAKIKKEDEIKLLNFTRNSASILEKSRRSSKLPSKKYLTNSNLITSNFRTDMFTQNK